jgi:hypothetical protein
VDQWDADGRVIKRLADEHHYSCIDFVERTLGLMGVCYDHPVD